MKILLAYPYFLTTRTDVENVSSLPMGLYYLGAALLAAGHDVVLANWSELNGQPERIEAELLDIRPDVLGISIFSSNRWGGIDAARIARRVLPETRIIFGGIGATFLSKLLLDNFPEIDFVLRGEGEIAFPAVLDILAQGESLDRAPNLSWRREGKVVDNPCLPLVEDLDSLPDPAKYFTFHHLSLSRGCPGKCTFCGSPRFWQGRVRFHSPAYLVDQIGQLHRRGVRFFFVSDDTFTLRRENVLEFCRLLLERGLCITWQAISRVDRVDEQVLDAMRRAGCVQISYGVESGSPRIRKTLRKHTTDDQIIRAFDLTVRHGMVARAYIIYGNPGETRESVLESAALLERIRPLVTLFHVLTVLPGTELYETAQHDFSFSDSIWLERGEDLLYLDLDPTLDLETVHAWGRELKEKYFEALPGYAEQAVVADTPDLHLAAADFYSRLGMTFDQGEYSTRYAQEIRDRLAEHLYGRALERAPDPKAYLGLGMLRHRQGLHEHAAEALEQGVRHFPEDPNLRLCYGICLMNLGALREALPHLELVETYPQASTYLQRCREALNDETY